MAIRENKYQANYDSQTATVVCKGTLDLRGKDGYKEIAELFDHVVNQPDLPTDITLDVRELEFLNSSGITTLGGFIIKLRNKGGARLIVKCSNKYSWQERSMKGLEKLMPDGLSLIFE
ncbi:MAG TPA: hypothetical protein DCQ37_22300 [Desulfobacteraceae bacterium]|nr:hypothetical protein [Desulfobacteraceae bacterium]